VSQKRDYYEVLSVDRSVDDATLKKTFRKLALEFHPDRNSDPGAEAKFKEVSEAYAVLSDANKRARYDQFGHEGLQGGNAGFSNVDEIFSQFGDVFGDLFGFGRRGGGRRMRRGADIEYPLDLSFEESISGCTQEISVPKHQPCEPCRGSGAKPGCPPVPCGTCGGVGEVITAQMFLRMRTTCPDCRGAGEMVTEYCADCGGRGRIPDSEKLSVTVPAGVDNGMQLRLIGKGERGVPGAPDGNLFVTIRVAAHPLFRREGFDIFCTVPVSYAQACLGAEVQIPTVHGEDVLAVPSGTPSGKVFPLRGRGVPNINGRGNGEHYVQVVVAVPRSLSPEEEALLRQLAEFQDERVADRGFWRDLMGRLTGNS
jgi:molecular chaperone DnaJ